jgi:hypothetical protein
MLQNYLAQEDVELIDKNLEKFVYVCVIRLKPRRENWTRGQSYKTVYTSEQICIPFLNRGNMF